MVKLLAKLEPLLYKCLIGSWIFYWLARASFSAAWVWRFHAPDIPWYTDLDHLPEYILVASVSFLIGRRYLFCDNAELDAPLKRWLHSDLTKVVAKIIPDFGKRIIEGSASLSVGYLLISFSLAPISVHSLIKPTACLADLLGRYELSERICELADRVFRLDWKYVPDRAFAVWQTSSRTETSAVRLARNEAVEKIYGAGSLELADRYLFVGNSYTQGRLWDPPFTEESYLWFDRAFRLAQKAEAKDVCIRAMSQMALVRDDQKRWFEVKAILTQSECYLITPENVAQLPEVRRQWYESSLWLMPAIAEETGNLQLCDLFRNAATKKVASMTRHSDYWDHASTLIIYAEILIFLSLRWLQPAFKRSTIRRAYRRASKDFLQSSDVPASIDGLNAMITIDLHRGRLRKAWEKSRRALNLVGVETADLSNCLFEDYRPVRSPSQNLIYMRSALFIVAYMSLLCWIER